MATAEELLRSSVVQPNPEGHIVVGGDRFITVPDNLKRLGVQYDHNMETVVFDCPRYWDQRDMSKMAVYINYVLSDGYMDRYPADNVKADGDIMHFEWTISRNVTQVPGSVSFLICVMKTDSEGNEERHWNSELCQDCYISKGMETEEHPALQYPDEVTQLLLRMATVEQINVQAEEMQALHDATVEVAQTAEETKNKVLDVSGYIKNSYAPAIKGNASGEIIRVDDVSPIEHDVKCLVVNKNLFELTGTKTFDGVTLTVDDDGVVHLNGTATKSGNFQMSIELSKAGTYYLADFATGVYPSDENSRCQVYDPTSGKAISTRNNSESNYVTSGYFEKTTVWCRIRFETGHRYDDCTLRPILMYDEVPSTYMPNITDLSIATVSCSSKNLWYSRGITYPRTVSGVTIDYDEETQIYTFNGTSTSPGDIYVIPNQTDIMHINSGETWTLRVYPMGGTIDGAATCSGKMSPLVNTGDYTNTIHANTESLYNTKTYTEPADIKKMYFYVYASGTVFNNFKCRVQFELSDKPSEFEKSSGIATSIPSSDGTCVVTSKSPTMTLFADTPGVIVEAEYNVDTMKFLNATLTDDRLQAVVDSWLTTHYTEAEGVSF